MSKYAGNGQFTIEEILLVYEQNKEIDLSVAYVQLDLYESIFNHTMSGSVSIIDAFNLQDILPLYGNENIKVSFYTQGNDANPVTYEGLVYKISEKHRISEHSSGYTIYFISDPAVNSQMIQVNRGYKETPSAIVEQLYKRINKGSKKPLETVKTKGIDTYTFGNVKPLQAISVLSKHAYSKESDHGYLFYEDNRQYNFKPLQKLYKKDPIRVYRSRPSGMFDEETQRAQEAHSNVQDLRLMEDNSFMDKMMEGQLGTSFNRFDLFTKQVETFEYDKEQYYEKTKSLGELANKKDLEVSYENRSTLRYGNDSKLQLDGISQGIMSKIEIATIRCEIVVFGDSFLRCGEVVEVNLPIWNKDQSEVEDMLTGNFLMSDIHHQLTQDEKYIQTIMLQKEAYEQL